MWRSQRIDRPMVAVAVRDQSADTGNRVIDVFRKVVAHRGADFRGGLIEQIISSCKAADIGNCLDVPYEDVWHDRFLSANTQILNIRRIFATHGRLCFLDRNHSNSQKRLRRYHIASPRHEERNRDNITMTAIASARRSSFGMSCLHCGNELIAPEWTEHRNERHIRHHWQCRKCHRRFETIVGRQDDGRFDK